MQLNDQQQAIVDWTRNGRGSANVVARAGCGKTFTLIRGVVREIAKNGLGELAIMAFNKSAGDEFKEKIRALADEERAAGDRALADALQNWKLVQAGTVHSFGFSAVRRWSREVKVDDKKVHNICVELEGESRAMAEGRGAINYHPSVFETERGPICQLVSLAKQSGFGFLVSVKDAGKWYDLAVHHAVNDLTEGGTLDAVIPAAQQVLERSIARDREVVDFDDMILAPLVHNIRMWPKDWVLIDEAQDTNAARRALALKMLKPRTGRLVAVGDDRQAIYGFTGADADSLQLIARELGSITLPLNVTYRCPKAVVAEANRLVPDLTAHESAPKGAVRRTGYSEELDVTQVGDEESKTMTRYFFEAETVGPNDAILCRNTKPLVELAYTMLAQGTGCRVEGRDIGENLVNLATRWKRIKTLAALSDKLEDYKEREVQKWTAKGREERAQAAEDKAEALRSIIRHLRAGGMDRVEDLVDWIRALFGDTPPGQLPNVVTLSTIHKSKGREWDRVYLLFARETLPSKWARKDWQLQQEENLEYVAITRAKQDLVYVD